MIEYFDESKKIWSQLPGDIQMEEVPELRMRSFKINGAIFNDVYRYTRVIDIDGLPSWGRIRAVFKPEFREAFNKAKMWERLNA